MSIPNTVYSWLARSRVGRRTLGLRRALMSLPHLGLSHECPSCGWRFRSFREFGEGEEKRKAHCPRCGALERHRALWLYLQRELGFPERGASRLLHFAPELALMRKFEHVRRLEYVTFDLKSPLAKVHGDICELPFADGYFDAILCNHVLEHIPDDRRAISELARVLRPGGWAMLQVPWDSEREVTYEDPSIVTPEARALHFNQWDHVRIYGRDYLTRLEDAGFTVKLERVGSLFTPEECEKYALFPPEILFFCRVGAVANRSHGANARHSSSAFGFVNHVLSASSKNRDGSSRTRT